MPLSKLESGNNFSVFTPHPHIKVNQDANNSNTVKRYDFNHHFIKPPRNITEPQFNSAKNLLDRVIERSNKKKSILAHSTDSTKSWIADKLSNFYHTFIWRGIKRVRKSVKTYGGIVDTEFSQVKGAWFGKLFPDVESRYGACWATSLCWLWKTSNNENFFDFIYDGHKNGKINSEKFNFIRDLQVIASDDWEQNEPPAFSIFGFKQVGNIIRGNALQKKANNSKNIFKAQEKVEKNVSFPQRLISEIIDVKKDNNTGFTLFSVYNKHGKGHVIAINIKDDFIEMFDPIFGVFKFDSKERFSAWFCNDFWPKSCYGTKIPGLKTEFNDHFEIVNLEKTDKNDKP